MRPIACAAAVVIAVITPPQRYDYPFTGRVIVKKDALEYCPRGDWACAHVGGDGNGICVVHMWRGLKNKDYERLMRHEVAHCNGWATDHPK